MNPEIAMKLMQVVASVTRLRADNLFLQSIIAALALQNGGTLTLPGEVIENWRKMTGTEQPEALMDFLKQSNGKVIELSDGPDGVLIITPLGLQPKANEVVN